MRRDYQLICDFMHFAFLPNESVAKRQAEFYRAILTDDSIPSFDSRSARSGRDLAATIMRERFEVRGVDRIRLGVSAGYDSRGLLGVALDVLAPENIIAVTSGQPGNHDFDTAQKFTAGILPNHYLIEIEPGSYGADKVVEGLRKGSYPNALSALGGGKKLPEVDRLYKVSGFLGDSLSGKRLEGKVFDDWAEAMGAFVRKNEVFRPSSKRILKSMVPADYDPYRVLPKEPLLPRELMSYTDQLDLCYRQNQRIRLSWPPTRKEELHPLEFATVEPTRRHITIYDDPRWQKSYLSMPIEKRLNQKHYKWMLKENWPEIFRDLVSPADRRYVRPPVPEDQIAKLKHSAATASHANWEHLWAHNENFNEFSRELIQSLGRRNVLYWLDPIELLKEFDKDVLGLGKILWCLISVELNFRAGTLPIPEYKPKKWFFSRASRL